MRNRICGIVLMLAAGYCCGCTDGGNTTTPPSAPPPGTVLSTPTIMSVIPDDQQLTISWSAVPGAVSYHVYMDVVPTVSKTLPSPSPTMRRFSGFTKPFSIRTGLANGTTYYLVVTAVNSAGDESAESPRTSGTPQWSGVAWTRAANTIDLTIRSLAIDPQSPATVYATTFNGTTGDDLVFKTTNSGASWSALANSLMIGSSFEPNGQALAADPLHSGIIYLGTLENGVMKTTDGGATWNTLPNWPAATSVYSLMIDPTDPKKLYAGTTKNTLWKTLDGGTTWSQLPVVSTQGDSVAIALAIDPNVPSTLYAGMTSGVLPTGGLTNAGIFKSTDGGTTWSNRTSGVVQGVIWNDVTLSLGASPAIWIAGGSAKVYRSTDGGISWNGLGASITLGQMVNTIAVDPNVATTLYAGVYGGGVYRSTDGGTTWSPLITGLLNLNVLSLAVDSTTGAVYAGTADGIFKMQ